MNPKHSFCFLLSLLFFFPLALDAQNFSASGSGDESGHRALNALLRDHEGRLLGADAGGFLNIWNQNSGVLLERFQLSPYSITAMILRPGKNEVTVIENDGLSFYRISSWNYAEKKKLFSLNLREPAGFINYSAGGNFILLAVSAGIRYISSDNGSVLPSPNINGRPDFAATGRSERTMFCYMPQGFVSYWDLETGEEITRFAVPSNINSPALLGNSRFFAGFDAQGLVVLDAVSGNIIIRWGTTDFGAGRGNILSGDPESADFSCIIPGNLPLLYHFSVSASGRLETRLRRELPNTLPKISTGSFLPGGLTALGTAQGGVIIADGERALRFLDSRENKRIVEAAVSSGVIAFLTEDSHVGFLPADYSRINSGTISLQESGAYNSISSDSSENSLGKPSFLLWQNENSRSPPLLKILQSAPETGACDDHLLDRINFRSPLRSVSMLQDRCLFLDSQGSISVVNLASVVAGTTASNQIFDFANSSPGSQDAVFANRENIIVGRSTGAAPFVMINTRSGETVPLPIPAAVGLKLYRGPSGTVYGSTVNRLNGDFQTSIFSINLSNPSQSVKITEYPGEDIRFSMAESGSYISTSLGHGEALLYNAGSPQGAAPMERGHGLPRRILEGGNRFIVVDLDGSISWHDNRSGRRLAAFSLSGDEWTLERDGRFIRGRTSR